MKIITYALIPLILSIGITPAVFADDSLVCVSGEVTLVRTTNPKPICVDESTANRWVQLGMAEIILKVTPSEGNLIVSSAEVIKQLAESQVIDEKPMEEELPLGIETIETRSGTITIDHDYLTPESAQLLSDELFFQRAVQVYHLALPAVGGAGIFYEQE